MVNLQWFGDLDANLSPHSLQMQSLADIFQKSLKMMFSNVSLISGLQAWNFIKKKLQYSRFPFKFAKTFFKEHVAAAPTPFLEEIFFWSSSHAWISSMVLLETIKVFKPTFISCPNMVSGFDDTLYSSEIGIGS